MLREDHDNAKVVDADEGQDIDKEDVEEENESSNELEAFVDSEATAPNNGKKRAADADSSDNDDDMSDEEYEGDRFNLDKIGDLDFHIIQGEYSRMKNFKSEERNELSKVIIRHILKVKVSTQ